MRMVRAFFAIGFTLRVSACSFSSGLGEGVAHTIVLDQQLQIFHRSELGDLENCWLGFGVWEEILRR